MVGRRVARPARNPLSPGMPLLQAEGILAVPGSGFGRGGYMRLSLTIDAKALEQSLLGFERAIRRARA